MGDVNIANIIVLQRVIQLPMLIEYGRGYMI